MSLAQVAEHYRAMSAADLDAGRRELWARMADDIDSYLGLAFEADLLASDDEDAP